MNFFSRVTYNDRMSPLDFDLFRKMHALMGVTPDFFEVCLMVSNFLTIACWGQSPDVIGRQGRCRHESFPGFS
jgi:chitin synthase